ncbi:MAG: hypothetical protein IJS09_02915 [Treponema sp.]|nr:hypothetical protein [Treponema sp.]
MLRHPIKKVFGLSVFYSIIIIGIFVLQFKNESVISRNIGLLRFSMAETQDSQGHMQLKNTMQVSFKGISFTADSANPAYLKLAGIKDPKPLVLTSWSQPDPLSCTFYFTDETSITFKTSDSTQKEGFSIITQLPVEAEYLSLSYKTASGFSVTEQSKNRHLIASKHAMYQINAPEINQGVFSFTNTNNIATYTAYKPESRFTFQSVPLDVQLGSKEAYAETLKRLENSIASISSTVMQDATIFTENTAVAYIAEMAKRGHYAEAVEKIPESLRHSSRRTYVSAPFLGSLVSMNQSLVMINNNMKEMIQNALAQKNMDIFSVGAIADYMLREDTNKDVQNLAAMVSALSDFAPTLSQATGILDVYLVLEKANSPLAKNFSNVVPACLETIEQHCSFTNDMLHLSEKEAKVSLLQAVDTGFAVLNYGIQSGSSEYEICGRLIINSAFATSPEHDARTLAEVYSILMADNTFYPHYAILEKTADRTIWAWTCAQDIVYTESNDKTTATISITFPDKESHYLIIHGVKPFFNIEIYGISFHTDARFETYNSSGYVYNEQTQTLFLKSRHKIGRETIKLFYTRPQPKPAAPAPKQTNTATPAQQQQEQEPAPAPSTDEDEQSDE